MTNRVVFLPLSRQIVYFYELKSIAKRTQQQQLDYDHIHYTLIHYYDLDLDKFDLDQFDFEQ